ncbi:MAG TPA: hypothetical protein GX016_02665 [Firmicutes bacterium]|jgi:uncharacterized protein YaaQ|nr:hypothetical protein [Bacillota bacterium]
MKLIVTVVQDQDAPHLLEKLLSGGYRATRLASTGGFLRQGNTTLLVGAKDEKVEEVLQLIEETCRSRKQTVTPWVPLGGAVDTYVPYPMEVNVGGATVFVLAVEDFRKL